MVGVAPAAVSRGRHRLSFFSRGVVKEQEAAAADAGGLRLDQGQHHLDRDGRVDRELPRFSTSRPVSTARGWAAATIW